MDEINDPNDPLAFLLSPKPAEKPALELPFSPGSFAEKCVLGWLDEADRIDSGALKYPGRLGEVISRANRAAATEAVASPFKFALAAEKAAQFECKLRPPEKSKEILPPVVLAPDPEPTRPKLTPAEAAEIARRLAAIRKHD